MLLLPSGSAEAKGSCRPIPISIDETRHDNRADCCSTDELAADTDCPTVARLRTQEEANPTIPRKKAYIL